MFPTYRLALIACASLSFVAAAAAAPVSEKSWTQSRSDVAPDPGVLFGQLANGMRYAIVHNDTPKHQVSLRLRIGSGSLEERDDQQGLAHFLEHMAFKGSTHVPEGEMIKLLERHGLAFGPDTNAQTGFTETVFMLDLPEKDPETVDLGLMLMRETASELTLSQKAMDPERGVVLSEERYRDTPDYEALKKRLEFMLPGQLAPHRLAIGQVNILKSAPVSLIRDYYAANYRPDRATLIVVGDIDPKAMEGEIESRFSNWAPVGPETKEPDLGTIAKRGLQTQLIIQPGAHDVMEIAWINPFEDTPESEAKDRRLEVENVAVAILTRRLEREARSDAPPFLAASVSLDDQIRSARVTSISVLPRPGEWKVALDAAVAAQSQMVAYGVTQAEVDREISEMRTRFQTAAAGAGTRRTPEIAQEIVRAVDEDEVVTSPAQDLERFERDVKGLTGSEVSMVAKRLFTGQGPLLSLTSPKPIDGGEATLAAAFAAARIKVSAAGDQALTKLWPYTNFGAPGRVATRRKVEDLDMTFATFANGVHLNIKPTSFRKDQILVRVRLGDGRLGLPKTAKTEMWAHQAMILGGLGKISLEEMEQVLASKLVGSDLALTDDALVLGGATRPEDLDVQLQVLAAYVSDPAFKASAFHRVQNALSAQLDQLDATPQGVFGREVGRLQHGGDLRWGTPDQADVKAATLDRLETLLRPILADSPLEVDVVGDVDPETVIAAVAKTFGALAPRPAETPPSRAELAIARPTTGAAPLVLHHNGRSDQSIAYEAWPTEGLFVDPQKTRAINVAAEVLELRLIDRVRIAEGSTYSPSVTSSPSDVFPTYGFISASVETPPAKITSFYSAVSELSADLREKGPTADELERAVKPRIETLTKAQQTNEYWMTWLGGADMDPRRLAIVRDTLPGYRKVTAADVKAAAKYLTDANGWRVEVTPAASPAAPQAR